MVVIVLYRLLGGPNSEFGIYGGQQHS